MNKTLIDIIKKKPPERSSYDRTKWRFWPSEASCIINGEPVGKCLRGLFYQWKSVPESNPVPDRVKLLGNIGHFVEYQTRKELLNKKVYPMEMNKKANRKFRVGLADDIILSGEVDIIAGTEEGYCGMEIKNYSNSTYQILNRPKYPHLFQTFLYAVYYKPVMPYFIMKYMPSMVSKYATCDVYHRIDWIDIDNETYPVINGGVDKTIKLSSIIRRFKEAKYYIKNNILPMKEFKRSSTNCKYCNYRDYCKKDKDGTSII